MSKTVDIKKAHHAATEWMSRTSFIQGATPESMLQDICSEDLNDTEVLLAFEHIERRLDNLHRSYKEAIKDRKKR